MKAKIITILSMIFNKKVCTAEEFITACKLAEDIASKDEDGMLSVKEMLCIVFRLLVRKSR